MPNIQVPERYKVYIAAIFPPYILLVRYRVPKLEGLAVGRHPVYGTSLKRMNVKTESDESLEPEKKKKKKRRKSGTDDNLEEPLVMKEEPESSEEPKKMKKKKKDKRE